MENLKETWKQKITELAGDTGYILIKQLAAIIETGETKVRNDIKQNRLGRLKMGPEATKCHLRIPVDEALAYIDAFMTEQIAKPPIETSPIFRHISPK